MSYVLLLLKYKYTGNTVLDPILHRHILCIYDVPIFVILTDITTHNAKHTILII